MTEPHDSASGEHPRIIRRNPTGPIPTQQATPDDTRTGIIRRAPTGPLPLPPDDAPTGLIRRAAPVEVPARVPRPVPISAKTAIAACVVSIISGWATAVVATDLITGWWSTDRLFCIAVGFLALVFAASTITGVILLLLRRSSGRYLTVAGAVIALLTFGSVFIAGARIPWPVYAIPVLPIASAVLALHPSTRRWATGT